jgi:DNA segregation ATPase FtsK/SpoIIIE-like protein
MTGTSVRNKHMFEMLCGIGALQNVILVTTMWDTVDESAGSEREKELRAKFWKSMIASGSQVARFGQTYSAAWQILRRFPGVGRPLRLQVEMVDEQKPLVQTAAGFALFQWLDHLLAHFRAMIAKLRQRLRDIPTGSEFSADLLREAFTVQDNFNKAHEQKALLVNEPIAEKRAYPQRFAEKNRAASELAIEAHLTSDQGETRDKVQETSSEEKSVADRDANIMTHEATQKVLNEGSADEGMNAGESTAQKRSKMAVERQSEEPLAEARACNKPPRENQGRADDEAERNVLVENRADKNRQTKEIPLELTNGEDKKLELRRREESKVRLATDGLWRLFADPDNSRHATDLVVLVGCTRKSFEIIELWQKQLRLVCCLFF